MRTVNTATLEAWEEIAYTKRRIYLPSSAISIPDANISSINYTESISDESCMYFVGCVAGKVELTLENFTTDIHLDPIEIYVQRGNTTELKVFTGKVYTCDVDEATQTMKVVAYDHLYRIFNADLTEWYKNLTFPMTMGAFRNAFFTHFGVTQVSRTLLFDSLEIQDTIGGDEILGRDIIKPLCEANCVFGHINENGEMDYFLPSNDARITTVEETSSFVKADYITALIDKVIVRGSNDDVGAVAGTGSNAYIIEGNMFFIGLTAATLSTIATTILNTINNIQFRPLECEIMYNPIYQLGDLITVYDADGNAYNSILLSRKTDFLRETDVAKGLKEYSNAASYSNDNVIKLRGRTNELSRTVSETISKIGYVEPGMTVMSTIDQKADEINDEIEQIWHTIDGSTTYYEGHGAPEFSMAEDGTVTANYPAYDWTTSFPCNGTIQLDEIYNKEMTDTGTLYPHFWYTEQNLKDNMRALYVDLDTGNGYRFVLIDGVWQWNLIADSDFAILFNQITQIRQDGDSIDLEVTAQGVEIVDHESRITTNTAAISTQATQISAKVNSRDHNGDSSFSWELEKDGFDVKANNSSVFKVNSNGAEIDGKVTAKSGYIGNGSNGFTITSTSMYNGKPSLNSSREGVYIGTNGISLGDAEAGEDFKVTPDGTIKATHGKIGAFELYSLNEDGSVGGLQYRDSDGRWGSIVGGVKPQGRIEKGLTIEGPGIYLGVVDAVHIYRSNADWQDDIFTFGYESGYYINSRWMYGNSNSLTLIKDTTINGNLVVTGSKNRVIDTADYGKRLLYALETPSPMFEDVGESEIAENGQIRIELDPIFAQTISTEKYQVFLQAYGRGECFVAERTAEYFIVEGTPGLQFGWRLIAKQIDMTDKRLEPFEIEERKENN